MTATKKELILEYIATQLGAITGINIYRDRTEPFRREECPVVNIVPLQNIPAYNAMSSAPADWELQFSVKIYTRGTNPDSLADALEASIYSTLMSDRSLGGRVMDVFNVDIKYQVLEGDQPIGITDMMFQTKFRTSSSDLTQ